MEGTNYDVGIVLIGDKTYIATRPKVKTISKDGEVVISGFREEKKEGKEQKHECISSV